MAVVGSKSDSNAATAGGKTDVEQHDMAMCGYSVVPNPSEEPATANSDISTTKDFSFNKGNQGTSRGAYKQQPDKLSATKGG